MFSAYCEITAGGNVKVGLSCHDNIKWKGWGREIKPVVLHVCFIALCSPIGLLRCVQRLVTPLEFIPSWLQWRIHKQWTKKHTFVMHHKRRRAVIRGTEEAQRPIYSHPSSLTWCKAAFYAAMFPVPINLSQHGQLVGMTRAAIPTIFAGRQVSPLWPSVKDKSVS